MPPPVRHPADLEPDKLLAQCEIRRTKRSGPGGQHRNKVETAVVLTHLPTGLGSEASERRSQQENRQVALFRLRMQLALEIRSPIVEDSVPSHLWVSRCRNRRIAINPRHDDFPALLAEALDVLVQHKFDVKSAAELLDCTPSQLVKLLKLEPRALALVNAGRTELQLPRLK